MYAQVPAVGGDVDRGEIRDSEQGGIGFSQAHGMWDTVEPAADVPWRQGRIRWR